MRIVILINSFGRGGAEKSTAAFMVYLANKFKSYEIIGVYLAKRDHGVYDFLTENNIKLYHISQKGYFRKTLAFVRLMKQLRPDIVHSVLFEANIVGRFASLFTKFYLIESLVNRSYATNREFRNKKLKFKNNVVKLIDSKTSFLVNHFHSVSKAVQDHYEEVYGKKIDCTVIRRGRKMVSVQKNDYQLDSQLKLFTIARQEYQKGLIYLFEALHLSDKNICLSIAGRGGDATNELNAYIKENKLEDKIEFVGFMDNLSAFFLESDVYISASFFEGSPGSVIEAMSYGLPLILSDIPEHREIAVEGENTIFFQLKNSKEITGVFDKVLNREYNLEQLGNHSKRIFSERFKEEIIYSEYDVMYTRIYNNLK